MIANNLAGYNAPEAPGEKLLITVSTNRARAGALVLCPRHGKPSLWKAGRDCAACATGYQQVFPHPSLMVCTAERPVKYIGWRTLALDPGRGIFAVRERTCHAKHAHPDNKN